MDGTAAARAADFTFAYDPGELRCGRGRVAELDALLATRDLSSALVVTGTTVGDTEAVMTPVRDGLCDRLAGVFAETTPAKTLATGLAAARRVDETGADAIVAVGGGSSLDVAKIASALGSHADPETAARRALETGTVTVAPAVDGGAADGGAPTPIVAVPTTLAGADLSVIAGVGLTLDPEPTPPHEVPTGGTSDRRLMPTALVYDTALFETTPRHVLCASAMNGFDKAIECLYSPYATPVTDATAMRGLTLMRAGFGTLPDAELDRDGLSAAVTGVILAQYGISTPGTYRASLIHAFGHGLSHGYDVHQGIAHAVLAPHVLRAVFDRIDGRRDRLAEALGVADRADDEGDRAQAVVGAVAGVRDDLELPTRLRALDALDRDALPAIAGAIRDDGLLDAAPVTLSEAAILDVLEAAW